MIDNLIARVKHNLQEYKAAKDAWIADKTDNRDIHENFINTRDTVEMGAHEDESELLAAIERLQAENERLKAFVDLVRKSAYERQVEWGDTDGYASEEYAVLQAYRNTLDNLDMQAAALADVETASEGGEQ